MEAAGQGGTDDTGGHLDRAGLEEAGHVVASQHPRAGQVHGTAAVALHGGHHGRHDVTRVHRLEAQAAGDRYDGHPPRVEQSGPRQGPAEDPPLFAGCGPLEHERRRRRTTRRSG